MITARELAGYVSLAAVLALLLSCGTPGGYDRWHWVRWDVIGAGDSQGALGGLRQPGFNAKKMPNFGQYRPLRTLDEDEFPLDSQNRRVIFIGDIHGMYKPFNQLLDKLEYDASTDVLIHTGDFLAKGLHRNSMATLEYMTTNNITGVRGNHDQQILEWRGWINWICSSPEGCDWLKRIEHHWKASHQPLLNDMELDEDLDEYLDSQMASAPSKDRRWWKLIPAGWKFLSGQYRIARDMSVEQYEYLLQLPLALYVPHAHAFVVHAGLLPSDPRYPYYDAKRQPLARIPDIFKSTEGTPCQGDALMCTGPLRRAQEMAILTDIPQNKDPWTLMNMRGVKNGKVFRKYTGKYWAKLWNQEMARCVGFVNQRELPSEADNGDEEANKKKQKKVDMPCYPATVVYGHSASRGLAPKRWSVGLDSGCVYGRRLTALVIGGPVVTDVGQWELYEEQGHEEDDQDEYDDSSCTASDDCEEDSDFIDRRSNANRWRKRKHKKSGDIIPFGGHHKGRIVSVKC